MNEDLASAPRPQPASGAVDLDDNEARLAFWLHFFLRSAPAYARGRVSGLSHLAVCSAHLLDNY